MINHDVTPVFVEKINANDESYLLTELLIKNGAYISLNEQIALIETSKTIFELVSPKDGYIFFNPNITGSQIAPGDLLAVIMASNNYSEKEIIDIFQNIDQNNNKVKTIAKSLATRFSKRALQLIEKHQLDPKAFANISIVKEKDVLKFLAESTDDIATDINKPI